MFFYTVGRHIYLKKSEGKQKFRVPPSQLQTSISCDWTKDFLCTDAEWITCFNIFWWKLNHKVVCFVTECDWCGVCVWWCVWVQERIQPPGLLQCVWFTALRVFRLMVFSKFMFLIVGGLQRALMFRVSRLWACHSVRVNSALRICAWAETGCRCCRPSSHLRRNSPGRLIQGQKCSCYI